VTRKDEPIMMSPISRNQRRLDGGIAFNVCDRIHEACAYEVESQRTVSAQSRSEPGRNIKRKRSFVPKI